MSFLSQVVAETRRRIDEELDAFIPRLLEFRSREPPKSLYNAIKSCRKAPIIAEVKRASPAHGLIREDGGAEEIAEEMSRGGAVAISVVTEPKYFKGSIEEFRAVRRRVRLPLLLKDFIVDERQIFRAYMVGADAVLLIAAIHSGAEELERLCSLTWHLGLEPVVEVQSERDLEKLKPLSPRLVGINNRNLDTLKVDLARTASLARLIKERWPGALIISESGVEEPGHVRHLLSNGADALLVGTCIMKAKDVSGKVRELVNAVGENAG